MLRIAVQSKGRLFEDTMALLSEADIKISTSKRTLLTQASNFPVEVLFLRDDDIPQTIASGVADIGIVGENEFVERKADIIYRLGFSKCRLSLAIHKEEPYEGLSWFEGKKIATSYPGILRSFLDKNNIKADIHVITGSVEIAPGIGLADGHRKLRLYPHQQQPERGGSSDEERSGAYRLSGTFGREKRDSRTTLVPHRSRKSRRRQEICIDERTYR